MCTRATRKSTIWLNVSQRGKDGGVAVTPSAHPAMPERQPAALRRSHGQREHGGDQHEAAEGGPVDQDAEQVGRKKCERGNEKDQAGNRHGSLLQLEKLTTGMSHRRMIFGRASAP